MPTRDQERAQLAWKHIQQVAKDFPREDNPKRKLYGSTVHGLPALIRNAGLSQALHFVRSRGKPETETYRVLAHLAAQLKRVDGTITVKDDLGDVSEMLASVRGADLGRYLRLTQEALACVNWYKRLVQGELKVDASEQDAEG